MKIAVTAAGGGLGSAIIRALLQETGSENIIGIARTPDKASGLGVEIRQADYNKKDSFLEALEGIDTVLLVSGMDAPLKRISQHRNVIRAALEKGVRKIVYTSIIGKDGDSTFDAIVQSNRQTEADVRESGMQWAIGRNGLYIEPDLEYIEEYKREGKIRNCAGEGLCSYTTRDELAYAYSQLILDYNRNGSTYNLGGEAISQSELVSYLNQAFGCNLQFEEMSPESYLKIQKEINGEFLGTVIAGIYKKIRNGEFRIESDYPEAAGRDHISWPDYFSNLNHTLY